MQQHSPLYKLEINHTVVLATSKVRLKVLERNELRTWLVSMLQDGVDGSFCMNSETLESDLFTDEERQNWTD